MAIHAGEAGRVTFRPAQRISSSVDYRPAPMGDRRKGVKTMALGQQVGTITGN